MKNKVLLKIISLTRDKSKLKFKCNAGEVSIRLGISKMEKDILSP